MNRGPLVKGSGRAGKGSQCYGRLWSLLVTEDCLQEESKSVLAGSHPSAWGREYWQEPETAAGDRAEPPCGQLHWSGVGGILTGRDTKAGW